MRQFEALRARPATSAVLTLGLVVGVIAGIDVLVRGPLRSESSGRPNDR